MRFMLEMAIAISSLGAICLKSFSFFVSRLACVHFLLGSVVVIGLGGGCEGRRGLSFPRAASDGEGPGWEWGVDR
jgi:hypothetical protein